MWWRRELRKLPYLVIGGATIGFCNYAFFPHAGLGGSIVVAMIGGILGMCVVDFIIPLLRRRPKA